LSAGFRGVEPQNCRLETADGSGERPWNTGAPSRVIIEDRQALSGADTELGFLVARACEKFHKRTSRAGASEGER
jgi:hypothetical protein